MTNILFIDIETAPKVWNFEELTEREQHLFVKKYKREIEETSKIIVYISGYDPIPDMGTGGVVRTPVPMGEVDACKRVWREQAGFNAEFNKIVCLTIGKVDNGKIVVKSLSGDEVSILKQFSDIVQRYSLLCAHYGKEFDYPVLCRKYMMHRLTMPRILNISGLKPWEISLIDTMELWKFGSYKHTASLDLIANCFGLPSPKESMDGSMVGETYYEGGEEGLQEICRYCEADVITLINVYRCMKGEEPIEYDAVSE